jgi:RES domain-containing protein
VEIEIPEEVKIVELKIDDLPPSWDSKPPILETQFIGDDFVVLSSAAVLKVPSSIVPPEFNYLINPAHPDSVKIKVISVEALVFDGRIVKR